MPETWGELDQFAARNALTLDDMDDMPWLWTRAPHA